MITEKHKSSLWEVLWDNSIGGIAIVSEDGSFLRSNPAFCKIVQYSEPELQTMTFQDITVPGDVDADTQLSHEVAKGERPSYEMVKSYVTKTNHIVWVHLRVFPFRVDGKFLYFVSQAYEVTPADAGRMGNEIERPTYKPTGPKIMWNNIIQYGPLIAFTVMGGVVGIGYILKTLGVTFGAS